MLVWSSSYFLSSESPPDDHSQYWSLIYLVALSTELWTVNNNKKSSIAPRQCWKPLAGRLLDISFRLSIIGNTCVCVCVRTYVRACVRACVYRRMCNHARMSSVLLSRRTKEYLYDISDTELRLNGWTMFLSQLSRNRKWSNVKSAVLRVLAGILSSTIRFLSVCKFSGQADNIKPVLYHDV